MLPAPSVSPKPLPTPRAESGKPLTSATYLRPVQMRPIQTRPVQLRPNQSRPLQVPKTAPRMTTILTLPNEPEDAGLTGGTRSLARRLLALNLSGSRSAVVAPLKLA
jgi:hypothetical protein